MHVCIFTLPECFLKDGLKMEICVIGTLSRIVEVVCLGEGSKGGGGLVHVGLGAGCSELLVGKWLWFGVQLSFIILGLVWYFC